MFGELTHSPPIQPYRRVVTILIHNDYVNYTSQHLTRQFVDLTNVERHIEIYEIPQQVMGIPKPVSRSLAQALISSFSDNNSCCSLVTWPAVSTLPSLDPILSTVCESVPFNLGNSSSLKKHKINVSNGFRWSSYLFNQCLQAFGQPDFGVDPYLTLRTSVHDRSHLLRWCMGWLSGGPIACCCGHPRASRAHLLSCLRVA
ncbi:hypothetical protein CU097_003042 [Rhizopus azygosporus]|uniref:Uncharacterized protein n=1 Tax=Rhizopus azygosporus TaxID=86630 RepID=A0A367JIT2_RHIAZ|nr:hypothetical protein CU097_003042 [Rhizopus azygosporus]